MKLNMIAAVSARNRVIGNKGALPWENIPADMSHFIRLTKGCAMIMGRKTLKSFPNGEPLKDRYHIVLSRLSRDLSDKVIDQSQGEFVSSTKAALDAAKRTVGENGIVWCIGGGEIYKEFFPHADELHLTFVEGDFEGDTHFPSVDARHWEEIGEERILTKGKRDEPKDTTPYDLTIKVFQRKKLFQAISII